jgi:hypothetical protein
LDALACAGIAAVLRHAMYSREYKEDVFAVRGVVCSI